MQTLCACVFTVAHLMGSVLVRMEVHSPAGPPIRGCMVVVKYHTRAGDECAAHWMNGCDIVMISELKSKHVKVQSSFFKKSHLI